MQDLEDLITEIEDELDTDVYYMYDSSERHFIPGTIIGDLILAAIFAYVVVFLGLDDVAKKHREKVREWLIRLRRGGDASDSSIKEDKLAKDLNEVLTETPHQADGEKENAAREELKAILMDAGMPEDKAEQHTNRAAPLIRDFIENESRS